MPEFDRTGPGGWGPMTGWSRGVCRGTGNTEGFGRGGGRGRGFGRLRGIAGVPVKEVAGVATVSVEKTATEESSTAAELESLNRQVQDVAALLHTMTEKIARWKKDGDNNSL